MYVADRTAVSKAKAAVVVVVDRQNIAHAEQYWRFLLSSHRVNKHKIVSGRERTAFLSAFHKIVLEANPS